jgi:hypothetical protein
LRSAPALLVADDRYLTPETEKEQNHMEQVEHINTKELASGVP